MKNKKKNVVKDEEVVSKKKSNKKAKSEKKADKKPASKKTVHDDRVLGKYFPTSAKGKVAAHVVAKGKITEKEAKALAKGKDEKRILYRIRRFGKKSGLFKLFPSKKTEGLWIFKAVGKLPGVKAPKAA